MVIVLSTKKKRMEINLQGPDQDIINCTTPVPKLQDLAILNIVTLLWKESGIKEEMKEYTSRYYSIDCDKSKLVAKTEVVKKVFEKLQFLSLPNLLKAKVSNFIAPIGFQLLEWIDYREMSYFHFLNSIDYIDKVCWTVEGKIDKAKTLKLQCTKHNLEANIIQVYKLACEYCVKNMIPELYNLLPENSKEDISHGIVYGEYDHLVFFWTCFVRKELSFFYTMVKSRFRDLYNSHTVSDCKFNAYFIMFRVSLLDRNLLGVKYFWDYLSIEERNNNIENWTYEMAMCRKIYETKAYYQNTNKHIDILCFLLSKMNEKEYQNFLRKFSFDILKWLWMDWQWQKLMVPTIQKICDFHNEQAFFLFLSVYAREIGVKFLLELWCCCPINCKKEFFQPCNERSRVNIILSLLNIEGGVEAVKFILNYASTEEKINTIFETTTNAKMLCQVINKRNLSLLDIVAAILPSAKEINQYRLKVLKSVGGRLCYNWLRSKDWQSIKNFFDLCLPLEDDIENDVIELANQVVLRSLVCLNDYELADKFVNLCFNSKKKIKLFKKQIIYYKKFKIVKKMNDFKSFKNLVKWCFSSDCDINQFKMDILKNKFTKYRKRLMLPNILEPSCDGIFDEYEKYNEMQRIVRDMIISKFKFKFLNKLLVWCFGFKEKIQKFKKKFALSQIGRTLFSTLYKFSYLTYPHGVVLEKFIKWLSPLERNIIHMFQNEIDKCLPYHTGLNQMQKDPSNLLKIYAKK